MASTYLICPECGNVTEKEDYNRQEMAVGAVLCAVDHDGTGRMVEMFPVGVEGAVPPPPEEFTVEGGDGEVGDGNG